MKKFLICFFTMTTIVFNISFYAFADTTKDTIEKNKVQFKQISGEIKDLDNKISSLDGEINNINSTVQNNKNKISSIEKEITTTQSKIEDTKKQIDEGQDILSNRLRAAYKSGSFSLTSYIAFIFESNGLSDLIGRVTAIEKIVNADNSMISELKSNEENLNNDIKSLNTNKSDIVKLNEENTKNLQTLVTKQNDLKDSKAKLNAQKSQIESVIVDNENKLIAYPIKVIDSSSSSINELEEAVSTLKDLLPQLSTSQVTSKVNSYVSKGNDLINQKKAEANSSNNNNNNNSSNNKPNTSKKTLSMVATAYYGHTITAMGTKPVRNPGGISTVAVDPNVIPLGSKVYVEGYGYAIAADTGGAIVGNKIDLFMNSSEECYNFGRQTVTVKIVAYPNEW